MYIDVYICNQPAPKKRQKIIKFSWIGILHPPPPPLSTIINIHIMNLLSTF